MQALFLENYPILFFNRYDLLTVLLHEIDEALGLGSGLGSNINNIANQSASICFLCIIFISCSLQITSCFQIDSYA